MFSAAYISKKYDEPLFLRKAVKQRRKRKSHSLIKDYKILSIVCFFGGLPYLPSSIHDFPDEENICILKSASFFVILCQILLMLFSMIYCRYLVPVPSALLTYSSFLLSSWGVMGTLSLKRRDVLRTMKLVVDVTDQVRSPDSKTKFKLIFQLPIFLVGFSILSYCSMSVSRDIYEGGNMTSAYILWYQVDAEHSEFFCKLVGNSMGLAFVLAGLVNGIAVLMGSMIYSHFGDIIFQYGANLKQRFQHGFFSQSSMSENLSVYENVLDLGQAIDDAIGWSVLFVYSSSVSCFFLALCLFSAFGLAGMKALIPLVLSIVLFSLYNFLSLAYFGNRIKKMNEILRDRITDCSNSVLSSDLNEDAILRYLLLFADIRSKVINVTGGNMFIIDNSLILTVGASLITFGVLILQM